MVQRETYSCNSSGDWIGKMCAIHLLFYNAFCTELFFLFAFLNSRGTVFLSVFPCAQEDVQNVAVLPSPKVTIVESMKRSLSRLSQGSSNFWRHWNQSHRRRSAREKHSRSSIPSPPLILGRKDVGQFTSEWPPWTLSGVSPFHWKLRRRLSILLISHLCRSSASSRWWCSAIR
jgi:hypothetical protein